MSDNRKSRHSVKKEDDDNDDNDNNDTISNEQTGKKRKWSTASIEPKVSSKKIRVKGACNYCYSSSLSPSLSAPTALHVPVVNVPGPVPSLIITQANSEKENTPLSPDLDSANATEPIKNTIGPLAATENTTEPLVNTNNTTKPLPNTENTTEPLVDTRTLLNL
ncbi:hypothetical protein BDR03DRAFT_1018546 [Suillus americanus]|nr:hypothetical protein BDR03DRAFT_1018546 [Suillus americanus]